MSGDVEATLAQAVYELLVDHPMWIGDDGNPLDYLPEREARIADFVSDLPAVLAPVVAEQIRQALEAAAQRVETYAEAAASGGGDDLTTDAYEHAAHVVREGGRP